MDIQLKTTPYSVNNAIPELQIRILKDPSDKTPTAPAEEIYSAKNITVETTDADAALEVIQSLVKHGLLPLPTVNGKPITKEKFLGLTEMRIDEMQNANAEPSPNGMTPEETLEATKHAEQVIKGCEDLDDLDDASRMATQICPEHFSACQRKLADELIREAYKTQLGTVG